MAIYFSCSGGYSNTVVDRFIFVNYLPIVSIIWLMKIILMNLTLG